MFYSSIKELAVSKHLQKFGHRLITQKIKEVPFLNSSEKLFILKIPCHILPKYVICIPALLHNFTGCHSPFFYMKFAFRKYTNVMVMVNQNYLSDCITL